MCSCVYTSSCFLSLTQTCKIVPLQDPVTWYGINYTGTQMTQWDFQNKGKSRWTGTSSFVLKVPLRHLRPSVIYSVPCDRIVQRAYSFSFNWLPVVFNCYVELCRVASTPIIFIFPLIYHCKFMFFSNHGVK